MSLELSNAADLATFQAGIGVPGIYIKNQEFSSPIWVKLIAGTAITVRLSGDSTVAGDGTTSPYRLSDILPHELTQRGAKVTSVTNAGQSGKSTAQWISTYLAADIAAANDVTVLHWGLNDPNVAYTDAVNAQTSVDGIRSGLTTLRASLPWPTYTVLLMMPNTVLDDQAGRTAGWFNLVRQGYIQAAQDFKCVYLDTAWLLRNPGAGVWINEDYSVGSGRFVHPTNAGNLRIASAIAEALLGPGLNKKATGLAALTLSNSWVAYGSGLLTPAYYIEGRRCFLMGQAKNGTYADGTVLSTLPTGARPPGTVIFSAPYQATTTWATCTIGINSAGQMSIYGAAGNAAVNFDSISFSVNV